MCMCPKAGHKGADKETTSPQATDGTMWGSARNIHKKRVFGDAKAQCRAARKKLFSSNENVMEDNMSMNNRKIAGFMSAESIYSLAFYIVMVAAIAGVGAGIMSKSAAAKGVSALSVLRANYQAEVSLLGYGAADPTTAELDKLSGGMLDAGGMAGVGTFSIINQPTAGPRAFAINVEGVNNTDVCMALTSTGFGSWNAMGIAAAALSSTGSIPSTAGTITASGTVTAGSLTTKALAKTQCANIAAAPAATALAFISN